MKKHIFVFLLTILTAWIPCGFVHASGDGPYIKQDTGVQGRSYNTNPGTGGGVYGMCEGKREKQECDSAGALSANCEYVDKNKSKLSCTTRECDWDKGYVLRKGFGVCWTKTRANDWCKNKNTKTVCKEDEKIEAIFVDNPYGKRGKAFEHNCFCADENVVVYDCGVDAGTPPKDGRTYTNVDDRELLSGDTCNITGGKFSSWLCDNNVGQKTPGETFKAAGKVTCVAQFKCREGFTPESEGNQQVCVAEKLGFVKNLSARSFDNSSQQTITERDRCLHLGLQKDGKGGCICVGENQKWDNDSGFCVNVPTGTTQCPADATGTPPRCKCTDEKKIYKPMINKCVDNKLPDLEKDYDNKHNNEQSLANRLLTGGAVAATGLGMMQAFQGKAEQRADAAAAEDMAAYIETFRCTYGNGKSVKGGPEEVELPGGNDATMMSLRHEYFALAQSLKDRKESLGMKPGIESEIILDKVNMGLYDDENAGISGGTYSSLYRANVLNSEEDQTKIDADKEKSEKRFKYGATVAGVGIVGGIIGNSLINGKLGEGIDKLGEKIKERKKDKELQKKLNVLEESTKNINIEAGENFDAALNQVIQGVLSKK